jgi:hypothetical protein
MTRPAHIPPPGSPLVGLSETLSEIAAAASRDNIPPSGIFGGEGTATAPPPQASLALFQLTGAFVAGPPPDWTVACPNGNWFCAPATRVEYYAGSANEWATPAEEDDSDTTPETVYVWAPASYNYNGTPGSGNITGSNPGYAAGTRHWCFYDEGPGCWCILRYDPIITAIYNLTYTEIFGGPDLTVSLVSGGNSIFGTGSGATGGGYDVAIYQPGMYLLLATAWAIGSGGGDFESGGAVETEVPISLTVLSSVSDSILDATQKSHCHCQVGGIFATIPAGALGGGLPAANYNVSLPAVGTNGTPGQVCLNRIFMIGPGQATPSTPLTLHFTGNNLTSGGGQALLLKIG